MQRPLATVIVGGLAGSTLFTLFVTPVIYRIFVPPLSVPAPAPHAKADEPAPVA